MLAWRFLRLHRPIGGSSLGGCLCLGEIQNDENIINIREFQEAEYHAICVQFSAHRHPVAAQSAREPYALTSSNIAFSRARGGIRGLETAAPRDFRVRSLLTFASTIAVDGPGSKYLNFRDTSIVELRVD